MTQTNSERVAVARNHEKQEYQVAEGIPMDRRPQPSNTALEIAVLTLAGRGLRQPDGIEAALQAEHRIKCRHRAGTEISMRGGFRKDLLPSARAFYVAELGNLSRANSKGWAQGPCPFHKSKSGKSFAVNTQSGAYYCFGCCAKGRSVVTFTMQLHNLTFRVAAQRLGAWGVPEIESKRSARSQREQQRAERILAEATKVEERNRRLKARATLLSLIEIYRTAVERLTALQSCARAESQDEMECIEVAALLVEEIREADRDYMTAAGLECEL